MGKHRQSKVQTLVWHYTCGDHLRKILETRVLRTTDTAIAPGERPAVWFSKEQHWERSAEKALHVLEDDTHARLDMRGTFLLCRGLGRIGVHPDQVLYVAQRVDGVEKGSDCGSERAGGRA